MQETLTGPGTPNSKQLSWILMLEMALTAHKCIKISKIEALEISSENTLDIMIWTNIRPLSINRSNYSFFLKVKYFEVSWVPFVSERLSEMHPFSHPADPATQNMPE